VVAFDEVAPQVQVEGRLRRLSTCSGGSRLPRSSAVPTSVAAEESAEKRLWPTNRF
jgi:hypothetical protein